MTATEPKYQRVSGTDLYWLPDSNRTIGFQATEGSTLGDTPSLRQTWTDTEGLYLFLAKAPSVPDADFAAALLAYLRMQGWPDGPRYLWLADPDGPYAAWTGSTLSMRAAGSKWVVSRRADFALSGYTLSVAAGSVVTLATAAQGWGFAFAAGTAPAATVFAPGGTYPAKGGGALVPMTGPTPGAWRLAIDLPNGADPQTDFARLSVGLRYFYADDAYVRALHLPTIVQPTTPAMTLDVALDVVRPMDPDRTHFSFWPAGTTSLPAFDSTFSSARGYGLSLTPLPAAGSVPDARLVFALAPRFVAGGGGTPTDYYLTLEGAFEITWHPEEEALVAGSETEAIYRLLCGTSGLEYLGMPIDAPSTLLFSPGRPAYASPEASAEEPALVSTGTTAWLYAATTTGKAIRYYAQPEDAPLYRAPPALADPVTDTTGSVFLDFLEVPALELSAPDGTQGFPIAPYRGLPAESVATALALEAQAIAPTRRQAILDDNPAAWATPEAGLTAAAEAATAEVGVTPQGLAVGVGEDGMEWTWVGIANDAGVSSEPDLRFTAATGAFRQALETNRLFMVMANADVFAESGSVAYQLTAEGIAEIRAEDTVPVGVLDAVQTYFSSRSYPVYQTEAAFVAALTAATTEAEQYALEFERKSGMLVPTIGDWKFQMSPRNWHNPNRSTRTNAMVVFKFTVGRSLQDLAGDLSSWTWPEVATLPGAGSPGSAQAELLSIFADAATAYANTSTDGRRSPYAQFMEILSDPNWTGILAFSIDVPLDTLPEPLVSLAAGIDTHRFYAHHVGFDVTPFEAAPGRLTFKQTSMFGLIDYQDPEDQYFESNIHFAFKVLQLTVGFRNSVVTDFSSRVELLINRLFGSEARLYPTEHGNNVILDGVHQSQTGPDGVEHGTYVFSMETQNTVTLADSALRKVKLLSTQLVTIQKSATGSPDSRVVTQFQMAGDLHFYNDPGFDAFSFGEAEEADGAPEGSGLRFGNLAVQMDFSMADRAPSFSLVTETLSFDMPNSTARTGSLYASFPLTLSGFMATPDPILTPGSAAGDTSTPGAFGYVSVGAPIQQSLMSDPWFGLVYAVDLGTLGALAGSAGLTLKVLVAWSAGGTRDDPAVYVGVQLPGVKDALGVELPLEGILTLGFRTIEFLVIEDEGHREYMLRFRNFALRFLGLAFPPGHNDIYLVGEPGQTGATKLGWYAAYASDEDGKKDALPSRTTRMVAARRLPPARAHQRKEPSGA